MRRVTVCLIPFTMCNLRLYLHACANVLQFTVLSWWSSTRLVRLLSMHRSKHSGLIINQLKLIRCVCIASCIVVGLHLRTAQWLHDTKLDMCANLMRNPFGYSETSNQSFLESYSISCNWFSRHSLPLLLSSIALCVLWCYYRECFIFPYIGYRLYVQINIWYWMKSNTAVIYCKDS